MPTVACIMVPEADQRHGYGEYYYANGDKSTGTGNTTSCTRR